MNKDLWVDRISYSSNFICQNSWWHKLWHKFKIKKSGFDLNSCSHEIWVCSCGKRWEVDSTWVDGMVYVDAEEQG